MCKITASAARDSSASRNLLEGGESGREEKVEVFFFWEESFSSAEESILAEVRDREMEKTAEEVRAAPLPPSVTAYDEDGAMRGELTSHNSAVPKTLEESSVSKFFFTLASAFAFVLVKDKVQ